MDSLLLRRRCIIGALDNAGPHVPTERTVTFHPTSDVVSWGTREKVDYVSYGYSGTSSTTYAKFNLAEVESDGAQVVYIFQNLNIPSGAVIKSVTCDVKAGLNSDKLKMYFELWKYPPSTSSSAVGTSKTVKRAEVDIYTLGNRGRWSVEELNQDVYMWVAATRIEGESTGEAYGMFYGANLNITYEY